MRLLTGCAPDPRRPGYRLLEVDRGRFASLPVDLLQDFDVTEGRTLAPQELIWLREIADGEAAYRAAVRALANRPHAGFDLRRRLIQKQHAPAAADFAIARLAAQGLLDDAKFAKDFAASRATRGRGPARLIRDLLLQGIDRRMAESAVREALVEEGIDPDREARAAAERRALQLQHLPAPKRRRRLMAFLMRRGFSGPAVRHLVEQLSRS